ncbi:hypothetical protein [Thalassospira xiamenensis]|uniref:Uncharacterized protein n=1 Tax=Thalassospira xiamenensis TaxID=220697 RepID=A0A285TSN2_9PROT|nr:hypothetical protein [Thalassospira xiamenensis]SOC25998.1 hypothetical protein SAMN05428964_10526 [Thalassospira xiamenensis]
MDIEQAIRERDEAVSKCAAMEDLKVQAVENFKGWFDTRKELQNKLDPVVQSRVSSYLDACRTQGMTPDDIDLVKEVVQNMCRLGVFAGVFTQALRGDGKEQPLPVSLERISKIRLADILDNSSGNNAARSSHGNA